MASYPVETGAEGSSATGAVVSTGGAGGSGTASTAAAGSGSGPAGSGAGASGTSAGGAGGTSDSGAGASVSSTVPSGNVAKISSGMSTTAPGRRRVPSSSNFRAVRTRHHMGSPYAVAALIRYASGAETIFSSCFSLTRITSVSRLSSRYRKTRRSFCRIWYPNDARFRDGRVSL